MAELGLFILEELPVRSCVIVCVVALGMAGPACAGDKAKQTAAAVGAADREFARRASEEGQAAAFRDYMDPEEGLAFTGMGKPARGAAAIFAAMGGSAAPTTRLAWAPTDAWGSKGEDMGVTTGEWALFKKDAEKPMVTGRYVTVWRRDKTGHWKGLLDIGEPDQKPMENEATRK